MTPEQRETFLVKYLLQQCSRMWKWYLPRKHTKYGIGAKATSFTCTKCGDKKRRTKRSEKYYDVDHITPVGRRPKSLAAFLGYLDRKFPYANGLQLLCKPCHKLKSNEDRKRGWT